MGRDISMLTVLATLLGSPLVPCIVFWFWVPLSSHQPPKRVPLVENGYWATKSSMATVLAALFGGTHNPT